LADGRSIAVVNWADGRGGWVCDDEDITESKRREAHFACCSKIARANVGHDVETLRFLAVNDAAVAHYGVQPRPISGDDGL